MKTITSLLLLLISTTALAAEPTQFYQKLQQQVEPYLNTKRPYPISEIDSSIPLQKGCKLVQINHLGRHGSRHISSADGFEEDIREKASKYLLDENAPDESNLTALGRQLAFSVQRLIYIYSNYPDQIGSLTTQGRQELENLGQRLFNNTSLSADQAWQQMQNRSIVAQSTVVNRAQDSRTSFLHGLSQSSKHDSLDLNVHILTPSKNDIDRTLHFYDHCQNFQLSKKSRKKDAKKAIKAYLSKPHAVNALRAVNQRFIKDLPSEEDRNFSQFLYGLCQLDANMQYTLNICPLLLETGPEAEPFFAIMTQSDNIKQFYKRGPSEDRNSINRDMAVDLLNDFLVTTQAAINDPNHPVAHLRFAHDSTILRMEQILRHVTYDTIYDPKKGVLWNISELAPMSANIVWQTYQCPTADQPSESVYKVRMLINERLVHFPTANCWGGSDPDQDDGLCPWSEVKNYYQEKIGGVTLEASCGILEIKDETDD